MELADLAERAGYDVVSDGDVWRIYCRKRGIEVAHLRSLDKVRAYLRGAAQVRERNHPHKRK